MSAGALTGLTVAEPIVTFVVHGLAQPAGSKRAFVNKYTGRASIVDANSKAKGWKGQVAEVAVRAFVGGQGSRPLVDGPLHAEFTFYAPRPLSHYGTGRNSQVLKPTAPVAPITRPDVLKLARGVEDALSSVVYRDDSQIVSETLNKRYGEPARCEVTISRFTETTI